MLFCLVFFTKDTPLQSAFDSAVLVELAEWIDVDDGTCPHWAEFSSELWRQRPNLLDMLSSFLCLCLGLGARFQLRRLESCLLTELGHVFTSLSPHFLACKMRTIAGWEI